VAVQGSTEIGWIGSFTCSRDKFLHRQGAKKKKSGKEKKRRKQEEKQKQHQPTEGV
jgi:hypothetical protein